MNALTWQLPLPLFAFACFFQDPLPRQCKHNNCRPLAVKLTNWSKLKRSSVSWNDSLRTFGCWIPILCLFDSPFISSNNNSEDVGFDEFVGRLNLDLLLDFLDNQICLCYYDGSSRTIISITPVCCIYRGRGSLVEIKKKDEFRKQV